MKKALFIDRDGTMIVEPSVDFQIDSLSKYQLIAGVISAMSRLSQLDYELVMVSNQDGLGTESFPMEDFIPPQQMLLDTLLSEGVEFSDILIDDSFEWQNSPNRKPRTGMLTRYIESGEYDLSTSYVIGDRLTDVALAENLGARAILFRPQEQGKQMLADGELTSVCALVSDSWDEITKFLYYGERTATIRRATKETDIEVSVSLDGYFETSINCGLGFMDHMLQQIATHAAVALRVDVTGDLHVDEHHTIEDVAITLGEALRQALGSKRGIERYGFALPMDECRAMVLIDLGGRVDFDWRVSFTREKIGDTPTEMFKHFFKSLAQGMGCNLHISAEGENEHHKIEGVFKAFARALKQAIRHDGFKYEVSSSKGVI